MSFNCPQCSTKGSLEIIDTIELYPYEWDENSLQTLLCGQCAFKGLGVYEESRRGSLDHEVISHWGYPLTEDEYSFLQEKIHQCPDPDKRSCDCPPHQALNKWYADQGWQNHNNFPMDLNY